MELTVLVDPQDFTAGQEAMCAEIVRMFGLESVFISGTYFSTQQLNDVVSSLKKTGYAGTITIVPSSLEHIAPLSDCRFGIPVLLNSTQDYDGQSEQAAQRMLSKNLTGQMYGIYFACHSTATSRIGADLHMGERALAQRMAKHDVDAVWLDFEGGNGVDLSVVSWFKQFNKKLLVVTDVWDKQTLTRLEALGVEQVLLADVFKADATLHNAVQKLSTVIPCSELPEAIKAENQYS